MHTIALPRGSLGAHSTPYVRAAVALVGCAVRTVAVAQESLSKQHTQRFYFQSFSAWSAAWFSGLAINPVGERLTAYTAPSAMGR